MLRNRQRPRNRKSLPVSIRAIPFWKAWTLAAWSLFWGENPKAVQPFVTWRRVDGGGPTDFTWGHYYNDYQSAKRDLMGRAQEQLNDQNEGKPPSLRAKLRMAQENKSLPGPHRPAPEKER